MPPRHDSAATRARLETTGERVTSARVQVLAALEKADQALSHPELESRLGPERPDRVTLYRVLDWLVGQGLAHRASGADRVWRFTVAGGKHEKHGHFECSRCGKVVCLDDLRTDKLALKVPRGFRPDEVGLTVRGRCAQCA
ncbi:MAG: Fur family transcriptional regulator [Burkholderiales bacterium]